VKHGSLFSGIGGFDLAAQWVGWENVFQVEIDKFCTKVLEKNFPNVKRYGDIKEFDGTQYKGTVDILSGGFPCQPFSVAGKRKGKNDDRYLWPEYLRIIREIKPSYIVGENVPGIIDLELDNIITDLESEGYTTEQFIIPACSVGAWHRRDRIWVIAYTSILGFTKRAIKQGKHGIQKSSNKSGDMGETQYEEINVPNTNSQYSEEHFRRNKLGIEIKEKTLRGSDSINGRFWEVEPQVDRVANGISRRLDRLKGLGNSIVPQIAYELFKVIEQFNKSR